MATIYIKQKNNNPWAIIDGIVLANMSNDIIK